MRCFSASIKPLTLVSANRTLHSASTGGQIGSSYTEISSLEQVLMTELTQNFGPRRHNRPLGETAEKELRRLLERDEDVLKELQDYETHISSEVLNSTLRCASSLANVENARHRQELALELHETLNRSIDALTLSDSALSKSSNYSTADSNVLRHLADISRVLRGRAEVIERISKDLMEASISVARAHETVTIAEEDHQGALTVLWHHKEEYLQTMNRVKDLQQAINRKKIPLQASFRLPPHVWEGIFDYVVSADGEMRGERTERIKGWAHGSRALMLSFVCYSWRVMVHSSPSLWRYIHVPLDSTFDISWKRINFYLSKCKSVPPIVSVYSPPSRTFQVKWLDKLVTWNHTVGLARLECCIDAHTPYKNISAILTKLPSPVILWLRDGSTSEDDTTPVLDIPLKLLERTNRMRVIDVCTHIEADSSLQPFMKLQAYIHAATVKDRWKIPSWLRESQVRLLRINTPWDPEDRQTPFSFISVQELEMPLGTLSKYLTEGYTFPSLHKITLINTVKSSDEDWERIKSIPFQKVHTIRLQSVGSSHITNFVTFVREVPRASSLELRGKTVDTLGTFLYDSLLDSSLNIELLTIMNYKGTASSILSSVRCHADQEARKKHALRKIVFVDSPNVDPETCLEITTLLSSHHE